jgi:hypothetical protein
MPRNGFGITALVLALIGLVFGIVPLTGFLALILGGLAVLFGLLGVARVRKGAATNKVMSWIGTGLGAVVVALGIWGMTIVFGAVEQLDRDMQDLSNGSPAVGTGGEQEVIKLGFGESYTWSGGEEITVSAPEAFTGADNTFNAPNGRYVSFDVTIVNNGSSSYQGIQADFTVQHNGRPAQENWMDSDTLPDVQIPPGGQTTITLVYDISSEPGEITVSAQPNMFANTVVYYLGQI